MYVEQIENPRHGDLPFLESCKDCPWDTYHPKLWRISFTSCHECGGSIELCDEHYRQTKERMP